MHRTTHESAAELRSGRKWQSGVHAERTRARAQAGGCRRWGC